MKMDRIVLVALLVAVLLTITTAYEMREQADADDSDVGTGDPARLIALKPRVLPPTSPPSGAQPGESTLPRAATPPAVTPSAAGGYGELIPPAAVTELPDRSETPTDPDHPSQRFLHSRQDDGQHAE